MIYAVVYLLIGCFLAQGRIHDIAFEASHDFEKDVLRTVAVALKWVATWPAWVGR